MDFNTILNALTLIGEDYVGDNVCSEPDVLKAIRFVGYLVTIAKYFVPIIIIGFGTLDLYKAVTNGSTDSFSKQIKSLGMRIILGVFIMFAPALLQVVLNSLDGFIGISGEYESCANCLLDPFNCNP